VLATAVTIALKVLCFNVIALYKSSFTYTYLRDSYKYDSTSIRRPFDCLSKVIKVTVT